MFLKDSFQHNAHFKFQKLWKTHDILALNANIVSEALQITDSCSHCPASNWKVIHIYQPYLYCQEGCGVGVACLSNAYPSNAYAGVGVGVGPGVACLSNAYAGSMRRASSLMPYPLPAARNP